MVRESRTGAGGGARRVHAGASAELLRVAMAEVQQLRVQEAVDAMVKSVERENIRKMQVAARPRAQTGLEIRAGMAG